MIPTVIHQFWDRIEPPEDVRNLVTRNRRFHPNWTHVLWNDASAASFIEAQFGADAVACFDACQLATMRADLLRMAAAIVIGGVYLDADMRCEQPLDALRAEGHECVLFRNPKKLQTAFFMTRPRHAFFVRAFREALRRVWQGGVDGVSSTTGPGLFNATYLSLPKRQRHQIRVLEYRELRQLVKPRVKLETHEAEGHWTEAEARGATLVDFGEAGYPSAPPSPAALADAVAR